MENEEENFGTRVEKLMKEKQVKPFDFYRAMNIVPQAFYDWKKKGQVPSAKTALKVAHYFGVSVEYLVSGVETNPLVSKVEELQERLRKISAYVTELTKDA